MVDSLTHMVDSLTDVVDSLTDMVDSLTDMVDSLVIWRQTRVRVLCVHFRALFGTKTP
jgi:hypothetical protein